MSTQIVGAIGILAAIAFLAHAVRSFAEAVCNQRNPNCPANDLGFTERN